MPRSTRGFEYENQVIAKLKEAGICGNIQEGAGASSSEADAEFIIGGQRYKLEIKLNSKAQMGGTSVRYQSASGDKPPHVECVETVDPWTGKHLQQAILKAQSELDALLAFIQDNYDRNINKIPFTCPKHVWEQATSEGLLVNLKLAYPTRYIENHYRSKGVYYMQIGGRGLFSLGKNPAGLPLIPLSTLSPTGDLEIRTARSGSKKNKAGVKMVGVGLRAQARLRNCSVSAIDMDVPDSLVVAIKVRNEWRMRQLAGTLGFRLNRQTR